MDDETPEVIRAADDAYEAIRSINHLTITQIHPAPTVYSVLGNLKGLGHMLPQACTQLAKSLGRSLDEYDVYEDDGRDPIQSVAAATDHLTRAAQLAAELGAELEKAQSAISHQGYRDTPLP
ncbi:hypothetical protein [Paenarthrobacter ureafaciens]|uniref:hypothetical protein n=1 Tax=Paenarthrobacter ureafaciens TaxID=37931 RepID=UPI0008A6DC2C|nr:hypothetical protein ARZXY2_4818 [Arthrobacter sp. ZXY-2]